MSREDRSLLTPRPLTITPDPLPHLQGSALIATGNTRVLCAVSVEESVPKWMMGKGSGWLSAEYSLMPGSTVPRARRERSGKVSGRTQEIQRLIGRSLRTAIKLDVVGERMFWVDCDVLEADGGTRTAAITGAYVALALAIRRMEARGDIEQGALTDPVAAISVGVVKGEVVVDLDYVEDSSADVDMNVVMKGGGHLIEVQGTGEKTTFTRTQLNSLLDGADYACQRIFNAQLNAIKEGLEKRPN
jgi:ribonuclease PH